MKINIIIDGGVAERLWMEPGDEFGAEIYTDDFVLRIPEDAQQD